MTTRILFWNLKGLDLTQALTNICLDKQPDIIVIAEPWPLISSLVSDLSSLGLGSYIDASGNSEKIRMYTRLAYGSIIDRADSNGVSIKKIMPALGEEFLLAAVHLPSKMYYEQVDQLLNATGVVELIRDTENDAKHRRTIVVGDFNMDPFESGMVSAKAFHGVMDRKIAKKQKRKINGISYPYFYNPMWSRLGDHSQGPSGTFKRNGSKYIEYFWRTFDQVLISPAMLDRVSDSSIEIVTSDKATAFFNAKGKWQCPSDHLPLCVTVN